MGVLIFIGIVVIGLAILFKIPISERKKPEGYESLIPGTYISGLGDVLSGKYCSVEVCNNRIYLFFEGRGQGKQEVLYDKVYSARIVGKDYVQQSYGAGKLLVFGAFALAMDKKHKTIYENYLEITYDDINCGSSTILVSLNGEYKERNAQDALAFVQKIQYINNLKANQGESIINN